MSTEEIQEIEKVKRKIPNWFNNLNQTNSKILIIYLNLMENYNDIDFNLLNNACKDISTFKENYQQMKIISEKNHAKVFDEKDGKIILWDLVKDFIIDEYKKSKGTNMSYVENVLEKIDAVDVMQTIRDYENSDFRSDDTKNRYFKFDKSIYILPSKYCIKTTLIKKGFSDINTLTSNYAENILRILFEKENIEFIDSNITNPFLPLYQEISTCLLEYRDNHSGLIDILEDMRKQGLNTIPLVDKAIDGETNLKDIDPFTFFSTFNRSITVKNRANILKYLKDDWELKEKIPTFSPNIPWLQPLKAWFFRWEKDRQNNDINTLWEIFVEILNDNIKEATFDACLNLPQVDNNLSFGLFWLNSDKYITTDSGTREYLKQNILSYDGDILSRLKYKGYFELLKKIKKEIPNKSFYEIVALKGKNVPIDPIINSPSYDNKNILLYGVPGVGKTHNTKKLISLLEIDQQSEQNIFIDIEENAFLNREEVNQYISNIKDRVKFITFHQSFGYEDFIEGFRPNEEGKIKLENGVFKELCEKAKNDLKNKYYLVIDEINRGNISKIFGELITLIEEDKRDSLHVTLPYSKDEFSIPSNLYIIGTMNSTDKSIALIDIALRRRFTFIHMKPNPELVTKYPEAKELMIALNSQLEDEHKLGHSYFIKIENNEDLIFTCKSHLQIPKKTHNLS